MKRNVLLTHVLTVRSGLFGMEVVERKSSGIKPVFLKYSWPPRIKDAIPKSKFQIIACNAIKQAKIEQNKIHTYAINREEETYNEEEIINDTYEPWATENEPEYVIHNNADHRKSFLVESDIETYESKVSRILNKNGAACNIRYLYSKDTERLTGPVASNIAVNSYMELKVTKHCDIEFLVTKDGITLTDPEKKYFFRRHFSRRNISYCDVITEYKGVDISAKDMFAVIAKAASGRSNICHLFRQFPDGRAKDVVRFINVGYELRDVEEMPIHEQ